MSTEGTDPRLEAFLREAYAREDVYRFRQVLREVATEVEARQGAEETPVIPLWRRPGVRMLLAAVVLALVVVTVAVPYLTRTDTTQLALAYAERSDLQVRGADPRTNAAWSEVRQALLEQRAEDALALLEQVPAPERCDSTRVHWYSALALLLQDKEREAREQLEEVSASGCQEKTLARDLLKEL